MMERFPEEIGQEIGLNQIGYLFVLDNDQDLPSSSATWLCRIAWASSLGVVGRRYSPAPLLNLRVLSAARFMSAMACRSQQHCPGHITNPPTEAPT
jgi:hypothetical protein